MARSQSSRVFKYVGAAAAAIAGGITIGYLVGQVRTSHTIEQPTTQQTPAPEIKQPAPPISPSSIHPRTANGNYTAPGAPDIIIEEERQPIIRRVTPPTPPKDSEATQEAPPPTPLPSQPTPTVAQNPDGSTNASAPAPSSSNNNGSNIGNSDSSSPNTNTAPKPAPTPSDPDFEQVTPSTPAPDTGASQDGTGNAKDSSKDSSKVQFRVQTGAYTDESNARSVADQLRGQGYATSTRSERVGDRLVYKVQVGAYHSKTGANKAADDLQKKGYPAYVSPMGP